jgi:4-amino-4-deoxy-L-arabinose transferase-like glycosyltransferase
MVRPKLGPEPLRLGIVLCLILATALAARLLWSAWTAPVPSGFSDAGYYEATALSLARGQGYSVAFDTNKGFLPDGEPTAFWPPGYSWFLAANYRLFGEGLNTARTANAVIGALTIIPIYFIGRRLFGAAAGVTGAAIAALLPSLVFWAPVLLSDTFFTFLFASIVAVLLYALRPSLTPRLVPVVLAGLLIGFATLVRGQALVLLPAVLLWWLLSGVRPRVLLSAGAAMLVAAVLVIVPWSVRNLRVMDSPMLLSANFGYNLRIGHADYSTGSYVLPQDLWDTQPGITFRARESVFNDLGTRWAIDYAVHHPARELTLSFRKAMWLWQPESGDLHGWLVSVGFTLIRPSRWGLLQFLLDGSYWALLAAAAAALLLPSVRKGLLLPLILFASWTAAHIVFFGLPRYHLPMLALLVPMAGASLVWLAGALRASLIGNKPLPRRT